MGRSVSYPSAATVITFADNSGESCTSPTPMRGTERITARRTFTQG